MGMKTGEKTPSAGRKQKLALEIQPYDLMKLFDNYVPSQSSSLIPYHLTSLHNARNCQRSSKLQRPQPVQQNGGT